MQSWPLIFKGKCMFTWIRYELFPSLEGQQHMLLL